MSNGHCHHKWTEVSALLDAGSEVATVTETWAAAQFQDLPLQQACLKLRAVNGAEVPYPGILLVDIDIFGTRCPDIPILVVKEPINLYMQKRKRRLPLIWHQKVTFPVLTSTGPAANADDLNNCLQSTLLVSQRTTKNLGTQMPSTTDVAPPTTFLWPSRTGEYLHTCSRRYRSTSKACCRRSSSSKATVLMLHQ